MSHYYEPKQLLHVSTFDGACSQSFTFIYYLMSDVVRFIAYSYRIYNNILNYLKNNEKFSISLFNVYEMFYYEMF